MRPIILGALLCLAAAAGAEEIVTFAVGEWAPYVGLSLPENGTAARIVREACAASGLKAKFEFYPWVRAERRVLDGLAFASFPYVRMPERESRFRFSEPILYSAIAILRAKGDERTAGFSYSGRAEDFKSYVVGTTAGSEAVAGPLRAAGVAVEETATLDQSVLKLERGRIQFVVEERVVIEDAIQRHFPGGTDVFVFLDRDFSEPRGYRLLVSRTYPDSARLLKLFDEGLAKVARTARP